MKFQNFHPLRIVALCLGFTNIASAQNTPTPRPSPTPFSKAKAKGANTLRAQFDVSISSDIEPSYYKSFTAPKPIRNSQGVPQPTPTPLPHTLIWRLPHKRSASGKMEVDSGAQWLEPDAYRIPNYTTSSLGTSGWYGTVHGLIAHDNGILLPRYVWKIRNFTSPTSFVNNWSRLISNGDGDAITNDPAKEIIRDSQIINLDSQLVARVLDPNNVTVGTAGIYLGSTLEPFASNFQSWSIITVSVFDLEPSHPAYIARNEYDINWHPSTDWFMSPKFGGYYWDEAESIDLRISTTKWQGHIEGNWRAKTIRAGEMANAADYWNDAMNTAWGEIGDLLGSGKDVLVKDAIKQVPDLRLRILLEVMKNEGDKLEGEDPLFQTTAPENQIITADWDKVWNAGGDVLPSPGGGRNYTSPTSQWKNDNGETKPKPFIDFNLLDSDRNNLSEHQKAVYDAMAEERGHWTLKDPVYQSKRDRYLYQGDNYDSHGFSGIEYRGVDLYDSTGSYVTGTFYYTQSPTPPANPNDAPNGG